MKVSKLADKIISGFVKEFYKTGDPLFHIDFVLEKYPDEKPEIIYMALRELSDDGFLNIFNADNHPENLELLPSTIRFVDENTLLTRGYATLKEVLSLIHGG